MLKVLGKSTSINVRKVLWLCTEMELPFVHEEWATASLPVDTPEFRALNPNAMVPVICDGAFVLWESNAICRYLSARQQRHDLLPTAPAERALVEQWMDWQATELNNSWRYAFMALVRKSPAHADQAAIESGIAGWHRNMMILEQQLRHTGAFITGKTFTVADVVLGLSTHRWFMTPMLRPDLPSVEAYYERLTERAGFRLYGRNGTP